MSTRTTTSGASTSTATTPAALPDLHKQPHERSDDAMMAFEYTEQLLTPENSRSETSSNNENAFAEDNPTLRRRSARVARASLRGPGSADVVEPEQTQVPTPVSENGPTVSDETFVNAAAAAAADGKRLQSSHLRHSIAVMEAGAWSETVTQDNLETDEHAVAPDTPVSKASQEPQPGGDSTNASLQQRTLRKRVERVLTQEDNTGTREKATPRKKAEKPSPPRRSSRLSILEKASDMVGRAGSVLGKRSSDMMEKGKTISRRASLRPRNLAPPKEETAAPAAAEAPAAKRRRVSESDLQSRKEAEKTPDEDTETPAVKAISRKPKRWLAHGLYTGQEHTNAKPVQSRTKIARRRSQNSAPQQRSILPLPMFAGERLLANGRDFQLPFDVFSPLPPGQPKPNEWRKTNKNVFVGEASSIWRANKDLELSKCLCTEETGCDENCQNRYMFYECNDGICGLGRNCGNRSFEELKHRTKAGGKYNIGVEVIKTEDRGYGVRSNRTFEPNQIIVEYTGEIITQTECEKRMRSLYKNNECYYLMYFDQNMIIDATRGSIARFVNHSCDPNCRMEKWTVAGKPRMALFAGDRGIMTGEELTYDYNFDPYSQKNVQQCRCGSSSCRGVLGPRPREKERAKELKSAKAEIDKRSRTTKRRRTTSKTTSTRRKANKVLDGATSRVNKQKLLGGSRAVKTGVKKAVTKARTTVSRQTTQRRNTQTQRGKNSTAKTTQASARKPRAAPKKDAKVPKVKETKARSKAPVRARRQPQTTTTTTKQTKAMKSTKAQTEAKTDSSSGSTSKLVRPSAETKAKILAAARKPRRMPKKDAAAKPAPKTAANKPATKRASNARVPKKQTKSPVKKTASSPRTTKANKA